MGLDPKLLQELIKTFQTELEEQSQLMTNNLLLLEKTNISSTERKAILENIFRAAHNLKGSSRGLGIVNVGEIAHHLESLFSTIMENSEEIPTGITDLCLEAVDKMRLALDAFLDNKPLKFNLDELLAKLDNVSVKKTLEISPAQNQSEKSKILETKKNSDNNTNENTSSTISMASESVRIQIDQIDKLSSIIEEIQVSKIAMTDHFSELNKLSIIINQYMRNWKQFYNDNQSKTSIDHGDNWKLLNTLNDRIIKINNDIVNLQHAFHSKTNALTVQANQLQDEIGMLRLVPASTLLATLPRYVRDLANELHKKIELEVKGEDVKIDKLVLEGLKDPINHLLRNAIDHGIEDSATRRKAKKSETGYIKVEIKDAGTQVFITITDDGAGIDTAKVATIAEQRNLISKEELLHMTTDEINELIFKPGFSTKDQVTEISGRGVGLDVVKSNMNLLKGNVSIKTKPGQGATFTMCVPLTLSSERGLLIQCGDNQFVLPTSFIQRVFMLQSSDLVDVAGGQAILIDGRPIPFRMLADVLAIEKKDLITDLLPTVVLSNGVYSVALYVDQIIGEREIVIKPLRAPLTSINYVEGATLLDHNQLAIVLHMEDLIKFSLNLSSSTRIDMQVKSETEKEKIHILVVDDSITTRTLEKNVLENKNYRVTTAVNGQEAWELLQKNKFSLLITDVVMPIMDGFALTERVKSSDKFRDLPVIIVTSLGSDAEKARGVEAGANAYVVKSEFESGALLDIVAQLV